MAYSTTLTSPNDFKMRVIKYILIFISRELPTLNHLVVSFPFNVETETRGPIHRNNLHQQHGQPHSVLSRLPFASM